MLSLRLLARPEDNGREGVRILNHRMMEQRPVQPTGPTCSTPQEWAAGRQRRARMHLVGPSDDARGVADLRTPWRASISVPWREPYPGRRRHVTVAAHPRHRLGVHRPLYGGGEHAGEPLSQQIGPPGRRGWRRPPRRRESTPRADAVEVLGERIDGASHQVLPTPGPEAD